MGLVRLGNSPRDSPQTGLIVPMGEALRAAPVFHHKNAQFHIAHTIQQRSEVGAAVPSLKPATVQLTGGGDCAIGAPWFGRSGTFGSRPTDGPGAPLKVTASAPPSFGSQHTRA